MVSSEEEFEPIDILFPFVTLFTTWHPFRKDDPLLESGLIGPVYLRSAEILKAR